MCTDANADFCPDDADDPPYAAPEPAAEAAPRPGLHRRTFLKAAALGTAAAAVIGKGTSIGPLGRSPTT